MTRSLCHTSCGRATSDIRRCPRRWMDRMVTTSSAVRSFTASREDEQLATPCHATPGVASERKHSLLFLKRYRHVTSRHVFSGRAVRDRTALLVVTIQSIPSSWASPTVGCCGSAASVAPRVCNENWRSAASQRVQVAAAAAVHEPPGRSTRQRACSDAFERCGCPTAASSSAEASVGDVRGSRQHSQSSTVRRCDTS